jgi:hypothetical protein
MVAQSVIVRIVSVASILVDPDVKEQANQLKLHREKRGSHPDWWQGILKVPCQRTRNDRDKQMLDDRPVRLLDDLHGGLLK